MLSGICNDGNTWTLNNGTMTARGTGVIENYGLDPLSPEEPVSWWQYRDEIEHLVILPGITVLGYNAFKGLENLRTVKIADTVTTIDDRAFTECGMTTLTIPDSVKGIDYFAFSCCRQLTDVKMPRRLDYLGRAAFSYCCSLKFFTVPHGLKEISEQLFSNCSNLVSVNIPIDVERIEYGAFEECGALAEIHYDGTEAQWNAIEIEKGNNALENVILYCKDAVVPGAKKPDLPAPTEGKGSCSGALTWEAEDGMLTIGGKGEMENFTYDIATLLVSSPWDRLKASIHTVTVQPGVASIGDRAFYHFENVTGFTIPDSVRRIGWGAFFWCRQMKECRIPDGVTEIETNTFANCDSMTDVCLPASLREIEPFAFYCCVGLKDVWYAGTEAQWNMIRIGGIGDSNKYLAKATVHYNSKGPDAAQPAGNRTAEQTKVPAAEKRPAAASAHCPSCGEEIDPKFKLCPYCGTKLVCPSCGEKVLPRFKACPYCGTKLS